MTFGLGLGAGLRALTAARLGMQTAGNNVANANTPGYSRQRVDLMSAMPFAMGRNMQIGAGVDIAGITRIVDDSLLRRMRIQSGLVGAAQVDYARYDELEGLLNEPDGGLSNSLASLFGSFSSLQTNPADGALRGGVVQAGSELAHSFQMLSRRLGDLTGSTFEEVRGLTRQVNGLAGAVAELNKQIITLESNGGAANDLRDARSRHIRELSQLVDVNSIEKSTGSTDLLVGGHLLVSGDRASQLNVARTAANTTELRVGKSSATVQVREGRIAALLRHESGEMLGFNSKIDQLARNLILEVNRHQTTGMPGSGPHRSLVSHYGAIDRDGDGDRGDEVLADAGLPFDVQSGEVYLTVTNLETGELERKHIPVDASAMTLRAFSGQIDDMEHLSASVDPSGRLHITADTGYGFDFSPRLESRPNGLGTFGGTNPTIGTASRGSFDLSGQTFPVSFDVTTGTLNAPVVTTVTLEASDFANPNWARVDELVNAINADLGSVATAINVGNRMVIRSNTGGAESQLTLTDTPPGTLLSSIGMTNSTVMGQDVGVDVTVEGTYTGAENDHLLFVPVSDGSVGITPNLRVRVINNQGQVVSTLNVGSGYEPGKPLELGNGVVVRFGPGEIRDSSNEVFELDVIADSDTSDVLVALGLNSFFHGTSAADIEVNSDILNDVDGLAAGLDLVSGDAGNMTRLLALRDLETAGLGTNTIEDFWSNIVGDVGFETANAQQVLLSQDQIMQHLEAERESISGVNLDEEMLDMVRYQQSFDAAARFLSTVQELTQSLINLGR